VASPRHRRSVLVDRLPVRLPEPLAREAVSVGGDPTRVLVAGGLVSGDTSSASAYTLDLGSGHVVHLPPLRTPVHDTAGASAQGDRRLVIGGGNAAEQSVVQGRDATGWHDVGHLPTPRSDLSAVVVGDRVYVVGGYDGRSAALAEVLVSRTGRRWRRFCSLPVPVRYAATVEADGSVWVLGGERSGEPVDAIQRVDLGKRRATVVGHLDHPLAHAAAVRLGGRILLVGGRAGGDRVTARMWWYRPGADGPRPAGRLPHPLADTAVVGAGASAYLIGGETPALTGAVLRLRWR
jgi:N-acetylneuraminic acid mutarotase